MASVPPKRKKDIEEEDALSASAKKQRTRVSFSCGECHRRKQKCDRQTPCSHCLARKVPDLCKPYTPGKAEQDISARLLRVERILEAALPQFCNGGASTPTATLQNGSVSGRHSPTNEEDSSSQNEDHDPTGGSFQSGKWYGSSVSGSVAPASFLKQLQNAVPEYDHPEGANGTRPAPAPPTNGAALESEPSAAENLKSLVQECGVSPHKISELLQELPPQRVSDTLVDYYFDAINWTRYPLVEKDFREAYASICANTQSGMGAPNPGNVRFLPLLFVVLAISVRLSPESIGGDGRIRRVSSLRYYWSSRRSLLIAAAVQPDSVDIVLTRLLSARFLTFDRRITECWSQLGAAVRTAQALGMHRDGSKMNLDPVQTEVRRRIWSYLYHADRSYALALGRPHVIIDEYTSTLPPLNIEDPSVLLNPGPPQALPLSSPTTMTFVILRNTLAGIIGRMVHHFQKVRSSHYSEVVNTDEELLRFMKSLPSHYAVEPDKSLDEELPFIPVHRFLLITEIAFVRISLHRPYILRKLGSERYSRSRKACFESALLDYQVRQQFRECVPKETRETLGNAYRVFQSAMISGIYLILEPKGKDSEAMHAILDGFMQEHEGVRELDETTRRELRTIEFLKQKASQIEGNPPPTSSNKRRRNAPPSSGNKTSTHSPSENPAQLLLGLQYPSPKPQPVLSSASSPTISTSAPVSYPSPSAQLTRSPTLQRIYNPVDNALSPLASGSPGAEDDPAQLMLDRWCNSVSQVPSMSSGPSGPPMSWAGEIDFGWPHSNLLFPSGPTLVNGFDNPDWAHWDQLVNTIQHPT